MPSTVKPKHSPLPWSTGKAIDSEGRLVYIPIFSGKRYVSSVSVYGHKADGSHAGAKYKDRRGIERVRETTPADEVRADADLIVRAVNSHAELVAAARLTVSILDGADSDDGLRTVLDAARAALAKAGA